MLLSTSASTKCHFFTFCGMPWDVADVGNVICSLVHLLTTRMPIYAAAEKLLVVNCNDNLATMSAVEVVRLVRAK